MNFLQLLASGASLLNFNFQAKTVDGINKNVEKQEGFKKVDQQHEGMETLNNLNQQIPNGQTDILNHILYNQRQELINRYLQLNLQLLEGKMTTQTHQGNLLLPENNSQLLEDRDLSQQQQKNNSSKKKIKKLVKCGHDDKAHYAKGLCNNCYHKYGRTKKPWNCPHEKLYAGGMCQNCYINMYNKKRRQETLNQESRNQSPCQQKELSAMLLNEQIEEKKETEVEQPQKPIKE